MTNTHTRTKGRPKRLPKAAEIRHIKSLYETGTPWRDIAEQTDIPLRTIMRWKSADPELWKDCSVHCRKAPYTKRDKAYWANYPYKYTANFKPCKIHFTVNDLGL